MAERGARAWQSEEPRRGGARSQGVGERGAAAWRSGVLLHLSLAVGGGKLVCRRLGAWNCQRGVWTARSIDRIL